MALISVNHRNHSCAGASRIEAIAGVYLNVDLGDSHYAIPSRIIAETDADDVGMVVRVCRLAFDSARYLVIGHLNNS
jgi:hypothetical protein